MYFKNTICSLPEPLSAIQQKRAIPKTCCQSSPWLCLLWSHTSTMTSPCCGQCWDQTRANTMHSKPQSATPHRVNQCWGFKLREEGQGTHLSTEHSHRHGKEPPSSAFLLDWGFLHSTAKFSKLLVESRANQNKHRTSRTRSPRTEGRVRKVLP